MLEQLRRLYRGSVPPPVRDRVRWFLTNLRPAAASAPADLRDLLGGPDPVPGPVLRSRVARDCSRREFLDVGRRLADSVLEALREAGVGDPAGLRWLDFGCGCGRVARHLISEADPRGYVGVDVDRPAVRWCQRHLRGTFEVAPHRPPTGLPRAAFDVVVAVSVFSHFDADDEARWLDEVQRLLVPGGVLVASTHSERLTFELPHLTEMQHRKLAETGFLFVPGAGRFNADIAFHTLARLDGVWGRRFERLHHRDHGMAGYQDVSVWRKPAPDG
jgi:SAM-dependent methyltransferase